MTIHSDIANNLSYNNICSRNGKLIKPDYRITGYKTFADIFHLIAIKNHSSLSPVCRQFVSNKSFSPHLMIVQFSRFSDHKKIVHSIVNCM